ncbi:HAD hydrolase family protein [Georgenia sp. TF02-10]|uniref:HAD family hydrolase n=1 Tax=Georgenia sp. TF02-10 TaxID=2917725 RepID=UPI001FA80D38|nr:HAD hydrolase family protein [Georgenia sp. TF02-10]UNX55146.1 HAD hydrolase family protein [Georgenia sp. TF02-10]
MTDLTGASVPAEPAGNGVLPLAARAARWREALPPTLPAAGADLLVALDIDGTLLTHDGELRPAVAEAVADLRDTGTRVVLATGRSLQAVTPVAAALGLTHGWAVCSNGAVVIRLDPGLAEGHEITDVVTFDPGPTLRLLREEVPSGLFAVEDLGRGFKVTSPFPMGELTGEVEVVDFEELAAAPATRVTLRAPELSSADFHDLVQRVGLHGVGYAVGWTAWLDISPEGVSKASALEMLRGRMDVRPAATVAVGDGSNDLEMLAWAAHGVAMGDAGPQVVAAADVVTDRVGQDGAAVVLRALLER